MTQFENGTYFRKGKHQFGVITDDTPRFMQNKHDQSVRTFKCRYLMFSQDTKTYYWSLETVAWLSYPSYYYFFKRPSKATLAAFYEAWLNE